MRANITIESLRNNIGEFLLVNVTNSEGFMGICDTTYRRGLSRKTFYIGNESLINIMCAAGDEESNRQIWQTSTIEKCKSYVGTRFSTACESYFKDSAPLSKAVLPVLELLTNGLYVVHVANVYPTDGAGNFFWNAYTVKHEIYGSAPYNPVIGRNKNFSPPFIVPTQSFSAYSDKILEATIERLRSGKNIGGLAYHLSGMFSALLCGHMNASACLAEGTDFPCIIIEPLNSVIYGDGIDSERITALACPFAKLSFDSISRKNSESFFLNRRVSYPPTYDEIRGKAEKMLNSGSFYRNLSQIITDNVEALPDAEMMTSAIAITELTDEQIQVLLNGETELDGRVIISPNYYESVVYACNYLQLKDRKRFIGFADAILNTPALSAAYGYVAGRLRYVMDAKVNEIFGRIAASEDPAYAKIKPVAEKYAENYEKYSDGNVKKFLSSSSQPKISLATGDGENVGDRFSSLAISKQIDKKQS